MWDKITDGFSDVAENFTDLGARIGESIGLVDKEPAYVSLRDGQLRHNIDLDGYSPEERAQAEAMLLPVAEELAAIEEELEGDVDPERKQMLLGRMGELEDQLVEVKWELEHQQFSYGKAFFGSIIPGGGLIAQGIGLDADKRLETSLEILTPSAEDVGATVGGTSDAGVSGASSTPDPTGKANVDELMNMITNDPDAFMAHLSSLDSEERNSLLTTVQTNLQHANQMFSMMSNFQKAIHDTQKSLIGNFRV